MRLTTGRARLTNALGDHGKRLARFAAAGQEADFVRVSTKVGSSAPAAALTATATARATTSPTTTAATRKQEEEPDVVNPARSGVSSGRRASADRPSGRRR